MEFYGFGLCTPLCSSLPLGVRLPLIPGEDARCDELGLAAADLEDPKLRLPFTLAQVAIFCGGKVFGSFWDELLSGAYPSRVDVALGKQSQEAFLVNFREELLRAAPVTVSEAGGVCAARAQNGQSVSLCFSVGATGRFSCGGFAHPPSAELELSGKIFLARSGVTPVYFFLDSLSQQ